MSAWKTFSMNTAPMSNSALFWILDVSNMLTATLSSMMRNSSSLMKVVLPPSQIMPGKILTNAACPSGGKEYGVQLQKKSFRRLSFTVITMSGIFPNMIPSKMHPWSRSQRKCKRSASTLSKTKRSTRSLRLTKIAGRTFTRSSPSKVPANRISVT